MNKLPQAKEKLSSAFMDLEAAMLEKIRQIKQDAVSNSALSTVDQEMINNLNNEINYLQKSLSELGIENESLKSENEKLKTFQHQASEISEQIKVDLRKIKKIINQN
jgi:hypothetical protein